MVFVSVSGPKDDRLKRLAIMDYDGAKRAVPDRKRIDRAGAALFTHGRTGALHQLRKRHAARSIWLDVASVGRRPVTTAPGEMAFSPRFSGSGNQVIYSLTNGGNTTFT